MALIKCPECGAEISDKAESCPKCGLPKTKDPLVARMSKVAATAVKIAFKPLKNPAETVDLTQLLEDLDELPADFNAGRTVYGIGSLTGGYVGIPGAPGLGIVREYLCIFFIPIFLLGLYVVKDWRGDGGVFLGKITCEKAAKYVNLKRQGFATVIGAIAMLIGVMTVIFLVRGLAALIFGRSFK